MGVVEPEGRYRMQKIKSPVGASKCLSLCRAKWRIQSPSSTTLSAATTTRRSSKPPAMAIAWKPLLPLLVVSALIVHEEWQSTPSCKTVPSSDLDDGPTQDHPEDLKVMMVADLLLLGSEAGYTDLFFRDYYMSKFFRKSFRSLKPDMLLVLGDVSARGSELSRTNWLSVLRQFHRILGPFLDLPLHVVLGDRDVGDCGKLSSSSVGWLAGRFPGLDSAGCGAFEISNVSFVSLNAVALLCGNNDLRFSIEKAIERESLDLRAEMDSQTRVVDDDESGKIKNRVRESGWRDNAVSSGSGPVLLLHFPLRQIATANCVKSPSTLDSRCFVGTGPYKLLHSLPPNATEYVFQALKPRMVFSAHTHEFFSHLHPDGTREVTVPALTWKARDDPGFVIANFRRNNKTVSISYCSLAKQSGVIMGYIYIVGVLVLVAVFSRTPFLICSVQW